MKKLLVLVFLISISIYISNFASAQVFIYDKECKACINIPNMETLELLKRETPIVIWTSPTVYDHKSVMTVNGHSNKGDFPVSITVTNPIGNIVDIAQVTPDESGSFKTKFNTASPLWKANGPYIISAQTGTQGGGVKVFRIQALVLPDVGADTLINYQIENGRVTSVVPDLDSISIKIGLAETEEDGILKLYLPRTVIDSKLPTREFLGAPGGDLQRHSVNYDDEFIVLLDGRPISKLDENSAEVEFKKTIPIRKYQETTILDTRILTIHFPAGTESVEIKGSFVVPEFGILAILILSASLGSIFLLRMTRLVKIY